MKNAYTVLSSILNSKRFTYAIILLFVLQASFVAFTFKYPTLFDEGFHLKIIDAFTQYRTPIIENQPQNLDILRDLAHEGSRFYHYVLSFIYTPVKLVVEDAAARLIAMRLLNVSFVAIGIWAYVKLITEQLGLKRAFGNFILLIFSTTPIFLLLSATVNYDNALFMLSPFFFIAFLRFYDSKKIDVQNLLAFLLLGIIISLIKFTFLAVFVIASVFVLYRIVKGHGKKLGQLSYLQKISIVKSKKTALLLLIPIVLLSFLFVRIYVVNLAQYGTPRPECQKTLGVERCIVNGVIKRNENLLATKDERAADKMSTFMFNWSNSVVNSHYIVSARISPKKINSAIAPDTTISLTFLAFVIGFLLYLKKSRSPERLTSKDAKRDILLLLSVLVICITFLFNYRINLKYHAPIAINARYIFFVEPILISFAILGIHMATKKAAYLRVVFLIAALFIATQGLGITTTIFNADSRWFWDKSAVQSITEPIIKNGSNIQVIE
jgi:hypothetical protein